MTPFIFLIQTLTNIYIMVILLRFLLQWSRADFYNPISQFTVRVTNPVLIPLRKIIPGYGGIDLASLVFAAVVVLLQMILVGLIAGYIPGAWILFIKTVHGVFDNLISLMIILLVVMAILSWFAQGVNQMTSVLYTITEPLVSPVRRILPPIGGLDLSVMALIIGLTFLRLVVVELVQLAL